GSAGADVGAESACDRVRGSAARGGALHQRQEAGALSTEERERAQGERVGRPGESEQAGDRGGGRARAWQAGDRPFLAPVELHVAGDEGDRFWQRAPLWRRQPAPPGDVGGEGPAEGG